MEHVSFYCSIEMNDSKNQPKAGAGYVPVMQRLLPLDEKSRHRTFKCVNNVIFLWNYVTMAR
jgi:hypothetical protein